MLEELKKEVYEANMLLLQYDLMTFTEHMAGSIGKRGFCY